MMLEGALLVAIAKWLGFDTSRLVRTPQASR